MLPDWLEIEEERAAARQNVPFQPSEEAGFVSLAGGIQRALAVAGAAFEIAPKTESPIEATLGARLKLMIDQWKNEPPLLLVPQYWLGRFRYDFAIVANGKPVAMIECDGKEFHSSEAARANDQAKNVAAWGVGAEIFRFTGSQIFRRDVDCVAGIEAFLTAQFRGPA